MIELVSTCVFLLIVAGARRVSAKTTTVLYSPEEVENARRNVVQYDWGQDELGAVLEACAPWIDRTDDEIWGLVTGQSIYRGTHVNQDLGCPSCGRDLYNQGGNYPWIASLDRPWKLECPVCSEVFPKNDFAEFHRSGLGPGGVFHRDRADDALLYNTDHPDPGDPQQTYGVDDGHGWTDGEGNRWFFVPVYAHWCLWTEIPVGALALGKAYLFTGDQTYAHKGAILLDRIADVYPDMDLRPCTDLGLLNSHGGPGEGRIKGSIWETVVAETLSQAYDMLYEGMAGDDGLVRFLSEKATEWELTADKHDIHAIRRNIETGLLREFIKSCKDRRIRGNEGMTQTAMVTAAAVLDDPEDTPKAIEWIFEPGTSFEGGGRVPATLIGQVDRDGVGNEAAPGYCFIWMNRFRACARVLERSRAHHGHDLHLDYPRLRRMYAAPYRLTTLDRYTPRIGDTGKTGDPGMVSVSLDLATETFQRFDEPHFAQLAYKLNADRVEGLHTSVFDAEPEAIQNRIRAVIDREGTLALGSTNLNGYGLTTFRSGAGDDRRAAWLYYGRNGGHGHKDRLNIGMYYRGMDIMPDLGYPEYTGGWPKRTGWTKNTISHNTVQVSRRHQEVNWIGHCAYFAASTGIGVVEVASPDVYPETRDYRRTLALVDLSDTESYLVDLFRVGGGLDHVLSFHAGEGEASIEGLETQHQQEGTYAGWEIAFGTHFDGPPEGGYQGSGFSYLYDVHRASDARPGWRADWALVDTWGTQIGEAPVHVRYHALSPCDEAALAHGDPPQNKPGNPRRLSYLLQHNTGEGCSSLFASVIEPYGGDTPNLVSVDRLDLGLDEGDLTAAGIRVISADGRTDLILSSDDPERFFALGDGMGAAGRFVLVSLIDGRLASVFLLGGVGLTTLEGSLEVDHRAYAGVVVDMHREEAGPAWIDVDGDLPVGEDLRGAQLRVHNDRVRDACYVVQNVARRQDGILRVDVGDSTFTRGLVSDLDYGQGYTYDFQIGDALEVQTELHLRIREGRAEAIRATTGYTWSRG